MNSGTYKIAGVLFIMLGIVGLYNISEAPGVALFALIGLIAGIAMVSKANKKF